MHQLSVKTSSNIPLAELIDSVVKGDEIVFTENDQPVAKLVAVRPEKPRPQLGSAKGLIILSDDFDAPLEDFDEYTK